MDIDVSIWGILPRFALSLFLGFIIGWEREAHKKPAGLRTNMMVALGSTAFTIITIDFYQIVADDSRTSDPLRIIEGIIGGLGFLGAGCIIQSRGAVGGITTAATIWVVGSIGLACGLGHYLLATAITIFAFTVLTALRFVENHFIKNNAG